MDPLFIVVIDDDRSICKALRRLLRAAQMEVETFASGVAFLHATLDREPDCLILDVRMPGLSGPELRDQLQGVGRRIPIVFITAHSDGGRSERGLMGKGTDVLRKPFGDQELLDAISRAVRRHDPRKEPYRRMGPGRRTKGP